LLHLRSASFLVRRMRAATITEFFKLQPLGRRLLVLRRRIVAAFTFSTF
jgi:hypothetical protein